MSLPTTNLDRFRFIRDEIKHEYTVLSSRLTSYITSQSFLVSAYAVALNNANSVWGRDFRLVFPLIVCITGLVLSWRAQPGIESAVAIIDVLHKRQIELYKDADVCLLDPTDQEWMVKVHSESLKFSVATAYVFSVSWAAMLLLTLYLRWRG